MKSNSKFEARSTKFETNTNTEMQMSERIRLRFWNLNFAIISDFDIRISNLLIEAVTLHL